MRTRLVKAFHLTRIRLNCECHQSYDARLSLMLHVYLANSPLTILTRILFSSYMFICKQEKASSIYSSEISKVTE